MVTQNADKKREQIHMLCMDEMVPSNHLLRIIDKAIDGSLSMNWWKINIPRIQDARAWILLH